MSPASRPTMRLHLWLETEKGVFFGQGRLQLLEYIEYTGSLNAAAKALGMSYRAAWGKIKTSEEALGFQLVEQPDGKRGGGQLSEAAKLLIASYRHWLEEVEAFALQSAKKHMDYTPAQYWSVRELPSRKPPESILSASGSAAADPEANP
ncbi:LysR family transcriptional regulator [Desulfovibrio mangrovi]|uniref:winged helix-turn-helix domain-containing protein n=1 Tax=Desulfovibrio mangrovi TaxID=2976983 RepID=UPI0022454BB8|nr:LysR family transcriptional regulator [Desulfovibrio mangrovi]UZP67741.1 LysR family transcriptional regulator [Desulfovibrio mangrovi]